MEYFFKDWKRIQKTLDAKEIMLFLDYDGTLTPIAPTPAEAVIPNDVKKILSDLSRMPGCSVSVVSGRTLSELKKIIGIPGIYYAGNHGFEIAGPDISFESFMTPDVRQIMERIKMDLNKKLAGIPGIFLEDKYFTLSLHYRLVDTKKEPWVKKRFMQICAPLDKDKKIKISCGKKVLEVRPPVIWGKGNAVLWLLTKRRHTVSGKDIVPVCVGDDVTDEDVFKAFKVKEITVVVGKNKKSSARYYVENPSEVQRLLKQILDLRRAAAI